MNWYQKRSLINTNKSEMPSHRTPGFKNDKIHEKKNNQNINGKERY